MVLPSGIIKCHMWRVVGFKAGLQREPAGTEKYRVKWMNRDQLRYFSFGDKIDIRVQNMTKQNIYVK